MRSKLRLHVYRGYPGNETDAITSRYAPGETDIKSGMLVTPKWIAARSRYEWVKGLDDDDASPDSVPMVYWAHDDALDSDVQAAGNLVGLSSLGNFVLGTPWIKDGEVVSNGEYLTFDGVTGNMKVAADGDWAVAIAKDDWKAPVDLGAVYVPDAGTSNYDNNTVTAGTLGGAYTPGQKSGADSLLILKFVPLQPFRIIVGETPAVDPQAS